MKLIIASTMLFSAATFASTDAEMCQQYGRDIASSSTENQTAFLEHLTEQVSTGTWTLSMTECNVYIQRGKHEHNFEIADLVNDG